MSNENLSTGVDTQKGEIKKLAKENVEQLGQELCVSKIKEISNTLGEKYLIERRGTDLVVEGLDEQTARNLVILVKRYLSLNGYYNGSIDDKFTQTMAFAIKAFQNHEFNITNGNGMIGPNTIGKIISNSKVSTTQEVNVSQDFEGLDEGELSDLIEKKLGDLVSYVKNNPKLSSKIKLFFSHGEGIDIYSLDEYSPNDNTNGLMIPYDSQISGDYFYSINYYDEWYGVTGLQYGTSLDKYDILENSPREFLSKSPKQIIDEFMKRYEVELNIQEQKERIIKDTDRKNDLIYEKGKKIMDDVRQKNPDFEFYIAGTDDFVMYHGMEGAKAGMFYILPVGTIEKPRPFISLPLYKFDAKQGKIVQTHRENLDIRSVVNKSIEKIRAKYLQKKEI